MGQVTSHERDVEIARLANRFAVVEALEHRQQPGMLLHRTRERVEVTRTSVARQGGPGGKRLARRGDRGIHILLARLRDARQSRSRGGVDDVEPRVALSFGPAPADEYSERPILPRDPLERRLIALG